MFRVAVTLVGPPPAGRIQKESAPVDATSSIVASKAAHRTVEPLRPWPLGAALQERVRSAGACSGRRSRSAMGACRLSAGSVRVTPRFVDACAAPRRGAPRFGSFRVAALFFQTRGDGTEKDTVAMRAITLW